MVASTAGVKARTPKPLNNDCLSNFEQPMAESTEAVWDFAKQGAAYSKDVYERAKAMADETNKVLEQSYSTVTKATADFNLQWIEMLHANTNSAFDFCRKLVGVKSPSEFLELSSAQARKQFETFSEQAKHLAALAQKVTSSASAGRRHERIPQSRMMRFLSLSTCGRGSDETPWSLIRIRSFAQLESLRRV
jgi:phasin